MNNFTISPTLNKDKVFILHKSELLDRWDPVMVLYKRKNNSFKYESKQLKEVLKSNPEYGANEAGIERNSIDEPRYIRITDIDEFGLLNNDIGVTAATIESKYILQDNDFLFARSGATVGKAYLYKKDSVPYPCFFAGYMIRYRLNENDILPEYLFAITQTQFYKDWVKAIQRPTGQPNINAEEFKSLTFPLPPKDIQQKVVNLFSKSYEQKKRNEESAESILSSIDTYLLKELEITLPTPPENTLQNRIFKVSMNEISGKRFDPYFHQDKFKKLDDSLQSGKYEISTLKKKSKLITSGATPLSKGDSYTEDTTIGVPFIRSGEIDRIDFDSCIYIKPEIHNSMLKSSQLKQGDLLIAIVGATIGEIGIYNHDREANINQAIALVRLNDDVIPTFAKEFYKSSIGKFILDRAKRPVARANINLDEIGALPIPVLPLDKQREIADHISEIRKQAQTLKDKTKDELKKASEEIEAILLN